MTSPPTKQQYGDGCGHHGWNGGVSAGDGNGASKNGDVALADAESAVRL